MVFSAGIAPAGLNPYAIAVMKEAGIDISSQKSKKLGQVTGTRFDYVITMCDRAIPAVTGSIPEGVTVIHQGFVTLSEIRKNKAEILEEFRILLNDISNWLTRIFPDCPDQPSGKRGENKR
jgi:arsenate reductase